MNIFPKRIFLFDGFYMGGKHLSDNLGALDFSYTYTFAYYSQNLMVSVLVSYLCHLN